MEPGTVGGRYEVRSAIGQGGFGTVWLARDTLLGRDVALKQVGLIPGRTVTDAVWALREARNAAALSHRNVVTIFDVVDDDGLWLVMEYVPSESLSHLIKRVGRLPADQVAAIGAQVADGLAAAHEAGTVHRDVKPANILVRADGVAKIADFGIARNVADPALTPTGLVTGTPQYLAPELARGGDPTPASDVWALGATLYAAVEGRPLVESQGNPMAVLHAILENRPQRPLHAGPLETVLRGMLQPDPAARLSMSEVARDLHAATSHLAAASTEPSPSNDQWATRTLPTPSPAPSTERPDPASLRAGPDPSLPPLEWGRRRRRLPRLMAALLAAVAAVVAVGLLVGGDQGESPAEAVGDGAGASSAAADPTPEATSPDGGAPTDGGGADDEAETSDGRDSSASPEADGSASPGPATAPPLGGGEEAESFLRAYYATATTDTAAGYSKLSPAMQQATGRGSYETFWTSIRSVDTSDFTPSGDDMVVTLRYTFTDGRVVEERQRIDLVRAPEGLLINGDEVLSSRTVGE